MDAEEMRASSRRAVDDWNSRRLDEFYAAFHPAVRYHGTGGVELDGVDALRAHYDAALAYCSDLTITQQLVATDAGMRIVSSLQVESGTAVDGSAFGFRGIMLCSLDDDGLVREVWEHVDPLR
jgi:hypothetical protein